MPNTQSMRCHVVSFLCRLLQTYKPYKPINPLVKKTSLLISLWGKKKKKKEALRANVSEHETDFFFKNYILIKDNPWKEKEKT